MADTAGSLQILRSCPNLVIYQGPGLLGVKPVLLSENIPGVDLNKMLPENFLSSTA
jgi:hypothetical protein